LRQRKLTGAAHNLKPLCMSQPIFLLTFKTASVLFIAKQDCFMAHMTS